MRFFLLLPLLIWVNGLFSQYKVEGTVTNGTDREPVIGATVKLSGTDKATISDLDGKYSLSGISQGQYILKISSVGFSNVTADIEINENLEYDIDLHEKIFDLPDVVIESITMTGGLSGVHKSQGSAHYIGQKELQKFSYSDINRTLRNIPGTNIQEEDGYGLRPNIGLRATGSERSSKITVMEDGILAAPAPYAAPAAYYFPSIARMEAIEILKGSSQIKYGPYTTGGAINLISTPLPTQFSGHADLIGGSDKYLMLHANLGNAHKNISYLVETLQYRADGFKNLDNEGSTGFRKEDYLAKFRIHTNPGAAIYQSVTFKIGQAEESSHETYLGLTEEDFIATPLRRYAGSQMDEMTTKQNQYSVTHFAELTSFMDVYTSIYRTEFARNWYKLDKIAGQSISNILDSPDEYPSELGIAKGTISATQALALKANNRSYYGKGIQSNFIFHWNKEKLSHKIDLGIRLHQDQIDRFQWIDTYDMRSGIMSLAQSGIPGTESNLIGTANAFSSFLQYKMSWQKLTITSGLRHENIRIDQQNFGNSDPSRTGVAVSYRENSVNVLIPGIGADYKTTENQSVFGGIHKGFAPPGSREGTSPEESWNYELGWRHTTTDLKLQILGYQNRYSNLLGSDLAASGGTGSQDLFNGGAATATGIEAELVYNLSSNKKYRLPVALAYTYSRAKFSSSFDSEFEGWGRVEKGDLLPYVPEHQLSANLSLEHAKFLFDISTKYTSKMLASAGTFDEVNASTTDPAFTVDLALNYKLSKIISTFININNATDNIYIVARRPAGLRPNQPRTVQAGLKANF